MKIILLLLISLNVSCQTPKLHGHFSQDSTDIYWTLDSSYIYVDTIFISKSVKKIDTIPFKYLYQEKGYLKVADGWIIRELKFQDYEYYIILDQPVWEETYYDKNWNPIKCSLEIFLWKE